MLAKVIAHGDDATAGAGPASSVRWRDFTVLGVTTHHRVPPRAAGRRRGARRDARHRADRSRGGTRRAVDDGGVAIAAAMRHPGRPRRARRRRSRSSASTAGGWARRGPPRAGGCRSAAASPVEVTLAGRRTSHMVSRAGGDGRGSPSTARPATWLLCRATADVTWIGRDGGSAWSVRPRLDAPTAAAQAAGDGRRCARRCPGQVLLVHAAAEGAAVERRGPAGRARVDEDGAPDHRAASTAMVAELTRGRRRPGRARSAAGSRRGDGRMSRVCARTADARAPTSSRPTAQAHEALVADLQRAARARGAGRRRARARAPRERGKLLPRERVDRLLRPRRAVPRALAAGRRRASTTTRRPAPGIVTGIGRVARPRGA